MPEKLPTPWYQVTISPARALVVLSIAALVLWMIGGWLVMFHGGGLHPFWAGIGTIGLALSVALPVVAIINILAHVNWSFLLRLNPSITIGKPRVKVPKAEAKEV